MTDTKVKVRTEYHPVVLHTHPVLDLDEEQFFRFCQQNKDLRIERTAEGDLEVMPPAGWETGHRNMKLAVQLGTWAEQDNTGIATDSSGGFKLPNGAVRAPDAAWLRRERLAGLTPEQKQRFLPLCPDFVIELRSPTDSLTLVQAKMREYIENGARLGWLIDTEERKVHVYQPNDQVEISDKPDSVSGDPILPSFVLDLKLIWEPGF
jgi:Uma2 family endonuclease